MSGDQKENVLKRVISEQKETIIILQKSYEVLREESERWKKLYYKEVDYQRDFKRALLRQNAELAEALRHTQTSIQKNLSRWNYKDEVSLYEVYMQIEEVLRKYGLEEGE